MAWEAAENLNLEGGGKSERDAVLDSLAKKASEIQSAAVVGALQILASTINKSVSAACYSR